MPPPACSPAALVLAACLLAAAAAIPMMSERVHCHVCGGEDHRALFAGQPPPPPCQPEPDLGLPRECPPDYKGCLTKYDGTTLTRTCTERAYEPCGVANGVVYCYCSGRLCNAQTETEMRRLRCAAPKRHRAPEDDEDAAIEDDAGSGDGDLLDTPDDCDVTTRQPPDATTARSGPASTATASSTTYTPGPGDDLEWGSSSQDSIEVTLEANATATAKTNGSGRGDAHRSHSSVVCVLAALFVALSVWRVDAAH